MGEYLAKKIGAAHGLLLGNSLTDWLTAGIMAATVWAALWILRKFIAARYRRYSSANNPAPIRLIAYLLGNTKQILFLAVALDAAQESLTLPDGIRNSVSHTVLILILIQVGLWAGRTVRFYLEIKELERGADRV